jgi:hypothetical protein
MDDFWKSENNFLNNDKDYIDNVSEDFIEESTIFDNHIDTLYVNNQKFDLPDNYLIDILSTIIVDLSINYNCLYSTLNSNDIYNLFVFLFCNINLFSNLDLNELKYLDNILNNNITNIEDFNDYYIFNNNDDEFEEINFIHDKFKYKDILSFYNDNKDLILNSFNYTYYKFFNYIPDFKNDFNLTLWIYFTYIINESF